MNKKFIVAVATSLILANGSTVVFADKGSDDDDKKTSPTVVVKPDDSKWNKDEKVTHDVERSDYLAKKEEIRITFKNALADAKQVFKTARRSLKTDDARQAAGLALRIAVSTATKIHNDSLKDLGELPIESKITDDHKIALKASLTSFLTKRAAIERAFNIAVVSARKTFIIKLKYSQNKKIVATAHASFLRAGKIARKTRTNALKNLGSPPVEQVQSEDND